MIRFRVARKMGSVVGDADGDDEAGGGTELERCRDEHGASGTEGRAADAERVLA